MLYRVIYTATRRLVPSISTSASHPRMLRSALIAVACYRALTHRSIYTVVTNSATSTSTSTSTSPTPTPSPPPTTISPHPSSSIMSTPSSTPQHIHLIEQARTSLVSVTIATVQRVYNVDVSDLSSTIHSSWVRASNPEHGELCLPVFIFNKKIKGNPMEIAKKLAEDLATHIQSNPHPIIAKVVPAGPYINVYFTQEYLTSVITLIQSGNYLAKRSNDGKTRVMIEYSQPNTHKAFHVGHMRNAALGDCLVRLYEQVGHPVVAANYFGDEGAHIAKCLWYLQRYVTRTGFNIDTIPIEERGEWLGECYSKAVEMLELDVLTKYPYPDVIAAKVEAIADHPNAAAPKNWHQVTLDIGNGKQATVICGGEGYKVGDLVAYMPVGGKWKDGIVTPKDFMGVESHGIMLAMSELGIKTEADKKSEEEIKKSGNKEAGAKPEGKPAGKEKGQVQEKGAKAEKKKEDKPKKDEKSQEKKDEKKKDEKKGKQAKPQATQYIYVLPADLKVGEQLTEQGRYTQRSVEEQGKLPDLEMPPSHVKVVDEINSRVHQVRETLQKMEGGDADVAALWKKTKEWSLHEFKTIYKWLNVRFDHDFTESEVAEESKQMVHKMVKEGRVFTNSNGATGADLSQYGLGFCMVLKSDGSGLYATKDLALAVRKFEQFHIDQSIYVVDAAQTLHFQQVFKTLELMGYERARLCKHLPYGLVVLPDGKMSSRKGTVILFSQLKKQLNDQIYKDFLQEYDNPQSEWTKDEIEEAKHAIAVATIKYGMLNHDVAKDIVFELDKWTAGSGNSGPYMMMQYARIRSILRKFRGSSTSPVDFTLLSNPAERLILNNLADLWNVIETAQRDNNPSALCTYLFDLAKSFSSWYASVSVKDAPSDAHRVTYLAFIEAVGNVIQLGLNLLGIQTVEKM